MEENVIGVFAELTGKAESELCLETRLEEDLEFKSLNKFALLALLEGVLGFAPDPAEADSMNTIREFVDYYEK